MSEFKGKSDIDEIIEQVNRLKKEKEELEKLDKKISDAANNAAESSKILSGEDGLGKTEKANQIKKVLSDLDETLGESKESSEPKEAAADTNEEVDPLDKPLSEGKPLYAAKAARQEPNEEPSDEDFSEKMPAKSEFELDKKARKRADKEFSGKKPHKGRTAALFIIGIFLILTVGAYITGYLYTKDGFLPNTYINGVNVSGMSLDEATAAVEENANDENTLVFTKRDGSTITLPFSRFGYSFNAEEVVKQELDSENHYLYFLNFFKSTTSNVTLEGSYDDEALKTEVNALAFGTDEPENAKIVQGDDGRFVIEAETEGTAVDLDKVYEAAKAAIDSGESEIDLEAEGLYKQPEITSDDLTEKLDELNEIFNVSVELDFDYTTEVVTYDTISDAFTFNEDGTYTVDQEVVWNWVESLRSKYDTLHKTRKFNSTLQGEIEINSEDDYFGKKDAIFGYMLNSDETAAAIVEAFQNRESKSMDPIYYNTGGYYYDTMGQVEHDESDEADVITDIQRVSSYVEVDLTNQTLWYYKDGEQLFTCGVVSGLPTAERKTYPGIYQLWMKETNKIMEGGTTDGDTYTTPCSFWNYISVRSIGIHDATWQSSFGGTRYLYYGSHGCVGVSYDSAKYIYENVPIGTVVIMYY